MARILLIEPLRSVAREIEQALLLDGHECVWTISGQRGIRAWSNEGFSALLMNFETDDWNATEVLAELLGSNRVPQHAVIYLNASATPATVADLAREIAPLMPLGQLVFLRQGGDFNSKLRFAIASAHVTQREEEV